MTNEEEMKEVGDELMPPNGLPEAPASANFRVWIDGFGVQFTIRSEKFKDVVGKLEFAINLAKERGWKPTWKEDGETKEENTPQKEIKKATPKQLNYLAGLLGTMVTDPSFIATYANQSSFAISKIIDAKLKT